jgi:hypothetical protein
MLKESLLYDNRFRSDFDADRLTCELNIWNCIVRVIEEGFPLSLSPMTDKICLSQHQSGIRKRSASEQYSFGMSASDFYAAYRLRISLTIPLWKKNEHVMTYFVLWKNKSVT